MKGKSQPKGKGAKNKTTTKWPFSPQGLTGIKQNIYDSFFNPIKAVWTLLNQLLTWTGGE